jgi:Uma2 family endonuclease
LWHSKAAPQIIDSLSADCIGDIQMTTLLRISQIETLAGQSTVLHDIDWDHFEAILEDLGEKRVTRIAYFNGVLEIKMPLPKHEKAKVLISYFVQFLLDEMEIDFEPYIQNNVIMRGLRKLDMIIDPPPDLAIEVDVTSKTKLDVYRAIAVPELWVYTESILKIYILSNGEYLESQLSPTFGDIPIRDIIPQFIERSFKEGRSSAIREFRLWFSQYREAK